MSKARKFHKTLLIAAGTALISALNLGSAFSAPLAIKDVPLFLNETPAPLNMLVMSRDHRMYYEAYNDASDLNDDGLVDIGYKPAQIDYYGYFDSYRCYTHDGAKFVPGAATANKKCSGAWSGDWLNYMTTSRIDALRKVLYGGLRSTDTAGTTILQRAYIPQDAHSWGKEYTSVAVDGYDISEYTPLALPSSGRRHLFANTTPSGETAQTGNTNPAINGVGLPRFRIILDSQNRIWEWVSKEQPVAGTTIDRKRLGGGSNDGVTLDYNLVVRVQVCTGPPDVAAKVNLNCSAYGGNYKPTGLLQQYGENDQMMFGLISGSYGKPHDGGVLRKPVASLKNELDTATGVFVYNATTPGIIATIDRLRITGFNGSQYSCGWIATSADQAGNCSMWGNPTAEMMYEALRYFAGKANATSDYSSGANNSEETTLGLKVATWNSDTNPYKTGNFPRCSKPFQTVISDISPSFDSDKVPGSYFAGGWSSDINVNASTLGGQIWSQESSVSSGQYFIGQSGGVYDGAPTPKSVSSFGNIRGLAPEAPAKEGSYNSVAVAYYGLTNDLNDAGGDQKVRTYAVALASPLPEISVRMPNGGTIKIVPFAKSVGGGYGITANQGSYQPTNQIVDFYFDGIPTESSGRFRVNFEDVEQGADHDMDAIAVYDYKVNDDGKLEITVTSEYAAGGIIQHMGYVISGSSADGTYLVVRDVDTAAGNDVNYFLDSPNNSSALPLASTKIFEAAGKPAEQLKDPLWYAAKWGGFDDEKGNNNGRPDLDIEWDADGNGVPDNYFLVTNALKLREELGKAFENILDRAGSSSSAAVSSGSISDDTHVYQATFDARDWSGHLEAYPISDGDSDNDGDIDENDLAEGTVGALRWDAAQQIPAPNQRRILTVQPSALAGTTGVYGTGIPFRWASLGGTLQDLLRRSDSATVGEDRLNYLRGDRTREGAGFRTRSSVLGDMVNSAPIFVGAPPFRYPDSLEAVPYSSFRAANLGRAKTIYVGANDGMLHAFDAETGVERFAYVPNSVFPNLYKLTDPDYAHQFYVDGTPSVIDAFFGGAWHTVLAAGLGKGGQGIYALDVTRPDNVTEAGADATVLWEFTDAQSADLGYTYSRPAIVRLKNGKWAAVFGNGYNNTDTRGGTDAHVSTTGNAVLYIVEIDTGRPIAIIDTGVGMDDDPLGQSRPNGLSTPALVDLDGDNISDFAFAGDLFGNLWKFDLRDANPANWGIMNNAPLFTAVNGDGKRQPITSRPQVDVGPNGNGMVVLFGTGKFLENQDRDIGSAIVQSFYGIYDANAGLASDIVSGRAALVQQTIVAEGVTSTVGGSIGVRVTSDNAVDPSAKKGWYIDLVSPSGFQGEMQVSDSVLRNGRVLFTTLIPDNDICAYGGQSWLMEMDVLTGSRLPYSPFDFNDDKSFNEDDYVTVVIGGESVKVPASGFSRDAIMSRPAVVSGSRSDYAIMTDTSGGGLGNGANRARPMGINPGPGAIGRQSWRQLR